MSQIKSLVAEAFSFLKNDINDREKMVLNVIDKEYRAAQQKRDLIDHQLKARNEQLLELEANSEEVIKVKKKFVIHNDMVYTFVEIKCFKQTGFLRVNLLKN